MSQLSAFDIQHHNNLGSDASNIVKYCRKSAKEFSIQIEQQDQASQSLPPSIVSSLVDKGILRLYLPNELGGLNLNVPEVLEILHELATIDGSLGWVSMVACESAVLLALLPQEAYEDLYNSNTEVHLASCSIPSGKATRKDDGWLIEGQWPFFSGSAHANFLLVHSKTQDGRILASVHEAQHAELLNDWHSLGLSKSSSGSARINGSFVRKEFAFFVDGSSPCHQNLTLNLPISEHFVLHMAAVATGILQHVIGFFIAQDQKLGAKRMHENHLQLDAIGRSITVLHASRSALSNQAKELERRTDLKIESAATSFGTARYIVEQSLSTVQMLFSLSGSGVIVGKHPLQNCVKDLQTIAQHANLSPARFAQLGEQIKNEV